MMAEKRPASSKKIALQGPSTAREIRRVLNSRLLSQILRFTTIQRFQYNLLISALPVFIHHFHRNDLVW